MSGQRILLGSGASWQVVGVILFASWTCAAFPAFAEDSQMVTVRPEQVGQIFCISQVGNDDAVIEGLISPGLKQTIADFGDQYTAFVDKNPGDKPPFGDGIPWTSVPDYASGCDVGRITLNKNEAHVEIKYSFPGYSDSDYVDDLVLKRVNLGFEVGFWRIENVIYPDGGNLKAVLVHAFDGVQ